MPAIVTRAEATLQADVLAAEFGESGGLRAVDAQGNVELNESTQQVRAGRLRAVYLETGSSTNELQFGDRRRPCGAGRWTRSRARDRRAIESPSGRRLGRIDRQWGVHSRRGPTTRRGILQLDDLAGRVTVQGRGRLRREGDEQLRVDWAENAVFQRDSEDTGGLVQIAGNVSVRDADLRLDGAERLTLGLQTVDGETKP